jgi:hypothetical protein
LHGSISFTTTFIPKENGTVFIQRSSSLSYMYMDHINLFLDGMCTLGNPLGTSPHFEDGTWGKLTDCNFGNLTWK